MDCCVGWVAPATGCHPQVTRASHFPLTPPAARHPPACQAEEGGDVHPAAQGQEVIHFPRTCCNIRPLLALCASMLTAGWGLAGSCVLWRLHRRVGKQCWPWAPTSLQASLEVLASRADMLAHELSGLPLASLVSEREGARDGVRGAQLPCAAHESGASLVGIASHLLGGDAGAQLSPRPPL